MGWVKEESMTDEALLEALKKTFPDKFSVLRGVTKSCSGSVYEYLTDYIKDYYDVTLWQCDRVAKKLADQLGIKKYYWNK